MILSQPDAESILEPYKNILWSCIVTAWTDYKDHYKHVSYLHTPRTRANIIHDHMVQNAKEQFDGMQDIELHEIKGLFLVNIEGQLLLRFKKLDEDKMTRNIPTQQTKDFLAQLDLPNMPPKATYVVAGYELNHLQTDIRSVTITCPNGKCNAWFIELQEEKSSTVIADFPSVAARSNSDRVYLKENDIDVDESHGQ